MSYALSHPEPEEVMLARERIKRREYLYYQAHRFVLRFKNELINI
jgi:hypothetical protein